MSHKLSRCRTLLILTTWVCVCVGLLLVWPPLPAPAPPLPATSPRPAPNRHPSRPTLDPALPRPAFFDPHRRRRIWGGGGGGGGGGGEIRLYRNEEVDEDAYETDARERHEHLIIEYDDDDDDDDDDGDDGGGGGGGDEDGGENMRNSNSDKDGDNNMDDDSGVGGGGGGKEEEREEIEAEERGRGGGGGGGNQNRHGKEEEEEEGNAYLKDRYEEEEDHENKTQYNDYEEEETKGSIEYTGGSYNVTPLNARILLYNRIPKCASSTMQTILRWCSRQLGYEHFSSTVYDQHQLSQGKQRELVANLTTRTSTTPGLQSYDRHLYYTDFEEQGAQRPAYINLVREPVERFISSFYYRRSKERLARILAHGHLVASPSPNWRNRTVEQCVVSGDAECSFTQGSRQEMVLTYFCGHQPFCRTVGSKVALQRAKQMVSEAYSVVGLVGHMEVSLRLMETLIPGYLTGALHSYQNIRRKEEKVNHNTHKPAVSQAVMTELRRRMAHDIDFYNFLKQRLFLQRRTFLG
ncbi:heparan sulfate 2-O-sulfotransferase pipe-like [Eriocheir sinensis]|uniref:heparan sulfate 2-O-sulfotransferase pipe-like n=1 Tax=Eriocheir sinensis TaxID=95602 RepID=UPI0021CADAD7|nr:heparan sulfate 2-O-sulfotransferase pipe-like [Eriocheir sinensis]